MWSRKCSAVFAFLVVVGVSAAAFAAGDAVRPDLTEEVKKWLGASAGLGMAIAAFGGALSQSRALVAAVDGIARNPGAAGKIFAPSLIVGLALIEFLVILAFMVTNKLAAQI